MKLSSFVLTLSVCFLLILSPVITAPADSPSSTGVTDNLDISAIEIVLNLLDTIAAHAPSGEDSLLQLASGMGLAEDSINALIEQRIADSLISSMIDKLLNSPAYRLYYAQYTYLTPEIHRQIFASLPYRTVEGYGDIGLNFLELYKHREIVRTWVRDIIARVNPARSLEVARQWLPPGNYKLPRIFFIYDGYGDAFARDEAVGFDLFGVLLSKRTPRTRFEHLDKIDVDEIEVVLAHELHHVYSRPLIYSAAYNAAMIPADWRVRWPAKVIRRLVNEGVAMQCNPLTGFKREIFEDSLVVTFWIEQYRGMMNKINDPSSTLAYYDAWLEATYHDSAMVILRQYLEAHYPKEQFDSLFLEHRGDRPMFIYTLGWWIISCITAHGTDREAAIDLLTNPDSLITIYNRSACGRKGMLIE